MKLLFSSIKILFFVIILLSACTQEDKNDCLNVTIQPVDINDNSAEIYIPNYISAAFYEIEYGQSGFDIGTGTRLQVNYGTTTISNLSAGVYDYYIRTNCGGESWSDWTTTNSFLID